MTAHTPGPWVIDNRPLYDGTGMDAKKVEKGNAICCVERSFDLTAIHAPAMIGLPCPTREEGDAIGDANAMLIAAAPDLLKAAKRALNVFKAQGESVRPGTVLAALDAAIAKAEGRP